MKLIDEGNTIPFISRYRKEATGSLNDEVLRKLFERLTYLRNLEEKKQQVLSVIEEQGKLTPELKKADPSSRDSCGGGRSLPPLSSETGGPERRSRRKKVWSPWQISSGLAADEASAGGRCQSFSSEEKEVLTVEDALNGARDIPGRGHF